MGIIRHTSCLQAHSFLPYDVLLRSLLKSLFRESIGQVEANRITNKTGKDKRNFLGGFEYDIKD
jgi:hypothetical protein